MENEVEGISPQADKRNGVDEENARVKRNENNKNQMKKSKWVNYNFLCCFYGDVAVTGGGEEEKGGGGGGGGGGGWNSGEAASRDLPPITTAFFKVKCNSNCLYCSWNMMKTAEAVVRSEGCKCFARHYPMNKLIMVRVTGAVDMKELADLLKKRLNTDVEIVSPTDCFEVDDDGGNGGEAEHPFVGDPKCFHGPGFVPYAFRPPPERRFDYGPGFAQDTYSNPYPFRPVFHAPQWFNDENPNSCHIL